MGRVPELNDTRSKADGNSQVDQIGLGSNTPYLFISYCLIRGTMDSLYTPKQIASLLNLKPTTIRKYIKDGKLKAKKINNHGLRIAENDFNEFKGRALI